MRHFKSGQWHHAKIGIGAACAGIGNEPALDRALNCEKRASEMLINYGEVGGGNRRTLGLRVQRPEGARALLSIALCVLCARGFIIALGLLIIFALKMARDITIAGMCGVHHAWKLTASCVVRDVVMRFERDAKDGGGRSRCWCRRADEDY